MNGLRLKLRSSSDIENVLDLVTRLQEMKDEAKYERELREAADRYAASLLKINEQLLEALTAIADSDLPRRGRRWARGRR